MGIKNPEMEAPRRLRGGSDIWDTPSGSILSGEFFSEPVGGPVVFSIGVRAFSVVRRSTGTMVGLGVWTRAVQGATQVVRLVLSMLSAAAAVQRSTLAVAVRCTNRIASKALSWTAQSIGMVMLPPPVVFAIQRYVLGVQGASVQMGNAVATSGVVVPRSALQLWLWQHGEEVLMQRGCVCILRSGTVVFVLG